MWIVCLADNSQEMSGLINSGKIILKKIKIFSAAAVSGNLRVN